MSHLVPASSGGFVYRAERRNDVSSATGPVVGPGTYTGPLVHEASPAPVPFHTSAERALLENTTTSAVTPGPGAYNADSAADALRKSTVSLMSTSAAFAKGVPRLAGPDKAKKDVPGPGQYDQANKWVKHKGHFQAPDAKQRVQYERSPSAPSIPARHQSYGYEEATDGKLVMQGSPERVHTGTGFDRVGPGTYELGSQAGVPGNGKAPTWSNSKAGRLAKYGSIAPGPGAYNIRRDLGKQGAGGMTISIGGVDVVLGGNNGTSSFASKAPRPHQRRAPDHEVTPGPGSYLAEQAALALKRSSPLNAAVGTSTAAFGSQGGRGYSAPTYWATPGPGTYNDPRTSKPRAGQMAAVVSQSVTHQFSSSAPRFAEGDNGVPGPGQYRSHEVVSLTKELERKAAISRPAGGFGTSGDRFVRPAPQDPIAASTGLAVASEGSPGPGRYDPRLPSKPGPRSETGAFASKAARFRPTTAPPSAVDMQTYDGVGVPKGDASRLGPGAYSQSDPWESVGKNRKSYKSAPFGSEANRSKLSGQSVAPGPGRYNSHEVDMRAAYKPMTLPQEGAAFGVQSGRFKGGISVPTYTPGPGAYTAHGDLVRKSFNITYAGVEVL